MRVMRESKTETGTQAELKRLLLEAVAETIDSGTSGLERS